MTTAHYENFVFYQIGFRCCADTAGTAGAAPKAGTPGITAPGKVPSSNPVGLLLKMALQPQMQKKH